MRRASDAAIKKTLTETAVAADREMITPFLQWRYDGRSAGNGWNSPVNNAEWGTDYSRSHRHGEMEHVR